LEPAVTVPKFDEFCRPVLEVLNKAEKPLHVRAIYEQVADHIALTSEDRQQNLNNHDNRPLYSDRI
jgi:restriction endonuclease Mrr